ncbi:MAG: ATP-dependent DNA helicase, partial [Candidatus Methanomethylophilaceae archaeon]|nr:ATP-dependent DNA helicase [Candidatus Methanomethylophilaceae archaeon]
MFCKRCKSLMPPGSTRCRLCGAPIDESSVSNQSCLFSDSMDWKAEQPLKTTTVEGAEYMPYEPRGCQMMIIEDIRNALNDGRHIVIESGTGTGKTIVSLAATLEHAMARGKKIVYLTRTISQSDQVMRELRAIGTIRNVSGIAVTGRNKSCPLYRGTPGFESLSPNLLSMMCDERKQKSNKGQAGGCRYYDRVKTELPAIESFCKKEFPTSEALDRYCEKRGACPYEAKKALMRSMDVVAVPYVHILSPDIRNNLMANLNTAGDASGVVLIIDEAHNFIDAARGEESFVINARLVDSAIDECDAMKRADVAPGIRMADFIRYFKNCMRAVATEKMGLGQKEYVFDGDFIEERMMAKYGISRGDFSMAVDTVAELGEERTRILMESGDTRISELETLGKAMQNWCAVSSRRFVRTMKIDQDGEYLSASCIEPENVSMFLRGVPGSVHMSGTLQPLNQYARVLGLPDTTRFRTYPSPFPPENRKVVYVDGVTTRQADMRADPGMQNRIERYIVSLCESVEKNTLVFFTSYN